MSVLTRPIVLKMSLTKTRVLSEESISTNRVLSAGELDKFLNYYYSIISAMLVREWAEREGLHPQTVWKWCREGTMPVPAEQTPTGAWLIHDPKYETTQSRAAGTRTVCYARVSSSDQKNDLQQQVERLKAFAFSIGVDAPEIVTEIGSGTNGTRRKKLNKLLADPTVGTIIVEHRDRFARTNMNLVESALRAQGRRVIVTDDVEKAMEVIRRGLV